MAPAAVTSATGRRCERNWRGTPRAMPSAPDWPSAARKRRSRPSVLGEALEVTLRPSCNCDPSLLHWVCTRCHYRRASGLKASPEFCCPGVILAVQVTARQAATSKDRLKAAVPFLLTHRSHRSAHHPAKANAENSKPVERVRSYHLATTATQRGDRRKLPPRKALWGCKRSCVEHSRSNCAYRLA